MKKVLISVFIILFIALLAFTAHKSSLPKVTVKTKTGQIQTIQGSHCWHYFANSKCVDMIGPKELIERHKVTPTVVSRGEELTIITSQTPNGPLDIGIWESEEKVILTKNTFHAPMKEGTYIYMIGGSYKKGSSSNIFTIEVMNKE